LPLIEGDAPRDLGLFLGMRICGRIFSRCAKPLVKKNFTRLIVPLSRGMLFFGSSG